MDFQVQCLDFQVQRIDFQIQGFDFRVDGDGLEVGGLLRLRSAGKLEDERGFIMAKGRKKKQVARKQVRAARAALPKGADLAAFIGVPLAKPLTADQSRRLLKPLPGYRAIMDNVADNLRDDNEVLELPHDPDEIDARLEKANQLAARNDLLAQVLAGSDGARQVEDGFLMKVLTDCARRVNEEASTHPELLVRWKPILDFLKKNRPGRVATGKDAPPTP